MKRKGKLVIGLLVLVLITFLSFQTLSAEWKTIIGTVSDYYQIETDEGDVYDVVENSQGDRLADQMGRKVKVTGMVEDEGYRKIITINSYTFVEENETAQEDIGEEIAPEETGGDLEQIEPEEENVEEEDMEEASIQEEDVEDEDLDEEYVQEEDEEEENVQEEELEEEAY